jgi:hypothetical protein
MSEELQEQQLVPIEEQISQELVKQNVTEAVIAGLKEKYGHLKIQGIEDRETYDKVKTGRKECKAFRVLAKKICEKGREDAVAIQKAWVKKQKDVTDLIAEIEDPLEEQEKAYEAAVAKDKEERKRKQEEQLITRQQTLTSMGALYSDGNFRLGDVSFELSLVKESENDIWEETILPKFQAEYEKVEAERIEQERIKQEREAEMERKQEEMNKRLKEIQDKEDALKKAQEEQERNQKEEESRKAAESKAQLEKRTKFRSDELATLGLNYSITAEAYVYEDVNVHWTEITTMNDAEWDALTVRINPIINEKKEAAKQKRLAEIEAQKEAERKRVVGQSRLKSLKDLGRVPKDATEISLSDLSEEEYDTLYANEKLEYEAVKRIMWQAEQDEKLRQEELLRQQRMDAAKDKEKWEEMMQKINEVIVYDMRSSQYRKKAMIMREKLEEIKAL